MQNKNRPLSKQRDPSCMVCNFILVNFVSSIIGSKLIPMGEGGEGFDDILVSSVLNVWPCFHYGNECTTLSWIITFQIASINTGQNARETFDTLRVSDTLANTRFDNLRMRYQIRSREYLNVVRWNDTRYMNRLDCVRLIKDHPCGKNYLPIYTLKLDVTFISLKWQNW